MDTVLRLLTFLLVLVSGVCIMIWAGWYNDGLDFVNFGRYAVQFPLGPNTGPIAVGMGALLVAYFIYPADKKGGRH